MIKKYHYIYKTTNILNNKFYIGMHSTDNLDDGYIGSGTLLRRSIKKYGRDKHKKEILEYLDSRESLHIREKEIVNEKLLNDVLSMNLAVGGQGEGSWQKINQNSELQRQKNKKGQIKQEWLRKNDPEWVKHKSEKISAGNKLAFLEGRKVNTLPDWTGKKHTEESKRKMSASQKGKHVGEKNSQYGTKWSWIHKDGIVRKVKYEDRESYLENGWKNGIKEKCDIINTCKKCNIEFNAKKKTTKYCSLACRNAANSNEIVDNFEKLEEEYIEHGTLCKAFKICGITRSKSRYDIFYKLLNSKI